jgi:hypothetical protein
MSYIGRTGAIESTQGVDMARHYHWRLLPAVAVILALVGVASASARPIDAASSGANASSQTVPSPCSEVCSGGAAIAQASGPSVPSGAAIPHDPRPRSEVASGGVAGSPTVVRVATTSGFHWGDAGIGAGGALALATFLVTGLLIVMKVRRRPTRDVAQQTT